MSFVLILLMFANSGSGMGYSITSQQIGPYETMQECKIARDKAVDKLQHDTELTIKGSCVQEEFQDKEVKLYEDDKSTYADITKKN
jgi:hypothetical protein